MDDLVDTELSYTGPVKKMTQGVLITNTKFTSSALKFGLCAGIDMMSFDYPAKGNLYDLIEETGLHPLTCLNELSKGHKKTLLDNGVITCKILADDPKLLDRLNLNRNRRKRVLDEINAICYHTDYDKSQRRS